MGIIQVHHGKQPLMRTMNQTLSNTRFISEYAILNQSSCRAGMEI
jgi:hypothetical protein